MAIKTTFTIKDLENLSGIKAGTIRIWEKRYNLFQPSRTESNIRYYDLKNLKRLLNVATINNYGIKISKIASISEEDIIEKVKEIGQEKTTVNNSEFLVSMFRFDSRLFNKTFNELLERKSFEEVFFEDFSVLLNHLGDLWACKTIDPVHERFISTHIRQKILTEIENVQVNSPTKKNVALFLPENEMHDIGLLYTHYCLLKKGVNSIFLGHSVPIEDLKKVIEIFHEIDFISYFTVEPPKNKVPAYMKEFEEKILNKSTSTFHLLGRNTVDFKNKSKKVKVYESIDDIINHDWS
ncbi:MAG: MerR family transcriptional regulator [Flavobacteriales bacterium]